MSTFLLKSIDGKLNAGSEYNRARLQKDLKEHPNEEYELKRKVRESRKQRRFYEGAVIPMWAYLDGNDYRDSRVLKHYHNEANKEFNGSIIIRAGKTEKIGNSSKGKLQQEGLCDRVVEYLTEQYGLDQEKVFDCNDYKKFRDTIRSFSHEYDTYIDYLVALRRLRRVEQGTGLVFQDRIKVLN